MGMPLPTDLLHTEWTAEMARTLPDDGNRYEVLDGELFVTPAPAWDHQSVLAKLFVALHPYVHAHGLGWLRWSPADIEFSPRRLVQPDLFVVHDRGAGEPKRWEDVKELLLVIEALSPSTARADRLRKRQIYQSQRVPEYWIVDLDARLVERWHPDDERPEIVAELLTWQPRADIAPLEIPVATMF